MSHELVILMGYNAAGKSSLVGDYESRGYMRLNRDLCGGTLDDLVAAAELVIQQGWLTPLNDGDPLPGIIFDNTYPTIKSRASLIALGNKYNVPVRCIHLTTSMEDAQLNACLRMVRKTGRLLSADELKKANDPNLFPVVAIYHYRKEFQTPTTAEGFSSVVNIPFARTWGKEYVNKAVIVDYDGTLRSSKGTQKYPIKKSDIKILPNRAKILAQYKADGYYILGASNQSGVDKGTITHAECHQRFIDTNEMLGNPVDEFLFCPHRVPPITCYCRKPNPGIGAYFIEKYKLFPPSCIMVGDMGSDKSFAARCGFKYQDAEQFFK